MAKKTARKKPKPRAGLDRQWNGGTWTTARYNSFIKSALRGARWPQKYEAVRRAFVRNGVNPKTGRKCKLHRCEQCQELFPQNGVQADHNIPVVGPEGFTSWDNYIRRLFVDADGFRILCLECHRKITKEENLERQALKSTKTNK